MNELLFGFAAIPMFMRLLHIFTDHQRMGVLIIIISKMVEDILLFLSLVAAILVGFGLAFVGLLKVQNRYVPLHLLDEAQVSVSMMAQESGDETKGTLWSVVSALGLPLWATVGENQVRAQQHGHGAWARAARACAWVVSARAVFACHARTRRSTHARALHG